ncbi:hypothetical protein K491DRAFT_673930 [Lophiostoma macrostomum CBS 122681]|uniref:Uncharacterized protein n=1 Tax=Lophiostoma macrostomum CBS 122681 TaxID=1314788 RepID=A0A6A6TNK5_9PLEO|nr:hypothetical protein K491DRAFT_673930 [Lophiostoma macrostomum CBS 122681]
MKLLLVLPALLGLGGAAVVPATTAVVFTTLVQTVVKCPPGVTDCMSSGTAVVTSVVQHTTTWCPATATDASFDGPHGSAGDGPPSATASHLASTTGMLCCQQALLDCSSPVHGNLADSLLLESWSSAPSATASASATTTESWTPPPSVTASLSASANGTWTSPDPAPTANSGSKWSRPWAWIRLPDFVVATYDFYFTEAEVVFDAKGAWQVIKVLDPERTGSNRCSVPYFKVRPRFDPMHRCFTHETLERGDWVAIGCVTYELVSAWFRTPLSEAFGTWAHDNVLYIIDYSPFESRPQHWYSWSYAHRWWGHRYHTGPILFPTWWLYLFIDFPFGFILFMGLNGFMYRMRHPHYNKGLAKTDKKNFTQPPWKTTKMFLRSLNNPCAPETEAQYYARLSANVRKQMHDPEYVRYLREDRFLTSEEWKNISDQIDKKREERAAKAAAGAGAQDGAGAQVGAGPQVDAGTEAGAEADART